MEFENGNNSEYFDRMRDGAEPGRICRGMIYVVKEGDTLYRIAKKYHVDVSELMYENPYVDIYQLQPGDEICIPVLEKSRI